MKNKKEKSRILHYNFFPKNRRGAMEIVLLVLLVFLVVTVVLFTFAVNPSYAKANVYDARFVESVYQKQDLAEFYIRQVGEEVFEKTGESDFKENFKMEFERYDFIGNDLKELKKIIQEGKFNVRELELAPKGVPPDMQDGIFGGNVLEVVINSWVIEDFFEQDKVKRIQITYTPEISVKFDLKN